VPGLAVLVVKRVAGLAESAVPRVAAFSRQGTFGGAHFADPLARRFACAICTFECSRLSGIAVAAVEVSTWGQQ
jgi:hypothetical protein